MLKLVFSPRWFSGVDCIFEVVAVAVTLLIAMYCYRLFSFSNEKRDKYFGLAFLAIAFSFIFKILTNITLYGSVLEKHTHGLAQLTFNIIQRIDIFYIGGLLFHRFLMLIGLLGIFCVIERFVNKKQIATTIFFIVVTTIFSASTYFVFHLTAAMLLALITFSLYKNHQQHRTDRTLSVTLAFAILLVSQIAFIFVVLTTYTYVVAEVIQLAGFILLLVTYYYLAKR